MLSDRQLKILNWIVEEYVKTETLAVKLEENSAFLPGVVSRKKQIIPVLTENA